MGTSLLEVLVAMVVLGVTAAGIVALHFGAQSGLSQSTSMSTAMDIATQRAEQLALEGDIAIQARNCPVPVGCLNDPPVLFPMPSGTDASDFVDVSVCSQTVDAAYVGATGNGQPGRFRLDLQRTALGGVQTGGYDARVAVCWTEGQIVRKVETRRLIAPRDRG